LIEFAKQLDQITVQGFARRRRAAFALAHELCHLQEDTLSKIHHDGAHGSTIFLGPW
jgi:Zn-dependent peptidase ImmA (M78 family)